MQHVQIMVRRHEEEILKLANEFNTDPEIIMVKSLYFN